MQAQTTAFAPLKLEEAQYLFPEIQVPPHWEALSGGQLNFVWRWGVFPNSVIVKQSPPFIAHIPQITLDPSRHHFEYNALSYLHTNTPTFLQTFTTKIPKLLGQDPQRHVLIIEDFGACDALDKAITNNDFSIAKAKDLGRFIQNLHLQTQGDEALARDHDHKNVQATRLEVQYQRIGKQAIALALPFAAEIQQAALEVGHCFLEKGKCLIMGDLWPASILDTRHGFALIDWELSHYGQPAQDIGHLAAHCWMLAHRTENPQSYVSIKQFWHHFVEQYLHQNTYFGDEQAILASQHMGAEILARTIGAFQAGYLYDGLPASHPAMTSAISVATDHLLNPIPFFLRMDIMGSK
ncbi:MAG: phosphotransferase [Rhodothermia bacterium]|nr:phosphotransferase [Rhodothermia bacterium]